MLRAMTGLLRDVTTDQGYYREAGLGDCIEVDINYYARWATKFLEG